MTRAKSKVQRGLRLFLSKRARVILVAASTFGGKTAKSRRSALSRPWAPFLLAGLWSTSVQAAEPCVQVKVVSPVGPRFESALAQACKTLTASSAIDPAAQVEVAGKEDAVEIVARLPEPGSTWRIARRVVDDPAALEETLLALLALPPAAKPSEPATPTSEKPPVEAEPAVPVLAKEPAEPAEPAASEPNAASDSSLTVAGTAMIASRFFFGHPSLGVGLVLSGEAAIERVWVVGLRGRFDPVNAAFDPQPDEFAKGALGGGLEFARRIELPPTALVDLGIGAEGLAVIPLDRPRRSNEPPPEDRRDQDDGLGDFRLRAFGKVWLPATSTVSFCLQSGFEVSPVVLARNKSLEARSLPPFGVELGVGVGLRTDNLLGAP